MRAAALQTAIRLIYPPRCLGCGGLVDSDFGLCGPCWRDTSFISGLVCDTCGTPLPGEADGHGVLCDDCLVAPRPWRAGRAALLYRATGRRLVLGLKHGDRHDIAVPAAGWLARAVTPLIRPDTVVVPVPLNRWRLLWRRYNQSALLAAALARRLARTVVSDALARPVATPVLDGLGREDRFATLAGAITAGPRGTLLAGRPVLLVDDVMTSGATFAAATEAAHDAGATEVCIAALARVAKEP
ncbi:Predicted amidophosphoribosyltransferases [Roseivivax marinus]|uniref:double zinc ribbon domain-containing protein n=1 Tax=Roseivivax marinus TaxID=1379903 RepID=UPI0008D579DE|nr:double zinc ribbon domain-containing protein [Roseivivax marinus]SEK21111.1 Predicted amidophosphoribosyltransferases [Roseivivax marinus]